ncbi:MAG: hypothetical protein IIW73_00525 [Clostridia bacterium]|nr:hypothetical protein [Clostridia bacterium]
MYLIGIFLCLVASIVVGIVLSKKGDYNKLDRMSFIFNIILSVCYVPISLFGFFSVFAADSMSMHTEFIQKIIEIMIVIGLMIPHASILSILFSVILRKKGKSVLGFIIQFIPLVLFIIMAATFELI